MNKPIHKISYIKAVIKEINRIKADKVLQGYNMAYSKRMILSNAFSSFKMSVNLDFRKDLR